MTNSNTTSQVDLSTQIDLSTSIGKLQLKNPILVASGTFGYAREMERVVDLTRIGGILPKTITRDPRPGNAPWRTVETNSGLLNAIGLDNDGIDYFIANHWPYLSQIGTDVIVSIAGKTQQDFYELTSKLEAVGNVRAIELNISCPNVSGGVDFGTDPKLCEEVVAGCRKATTATLLAKLTPNVSSIATIAKAAEQGGADAVSCINTVLGMAIDWRKRKPILGNVVGGLSGPAIKPIALRCVYQVSRAVKIPVVGIGGISNIDDVMEFLVAGAAAVQIGTANYYDPTISVRLVEQLEQILREMGASSVREIVGSLTIPQNK
ncbi:MAG: dihydroorotate dehydrogenase [Planctomycetaceae bacterium]|nr:dihydroorotate dehydrogenase [Planctomycetaceae bacterium]